MSKERGITIAVPKKYEETCLINVQKLRALNCLLPIEIWEIGEEISKEIRAEFKKIENVFFKNVYDFCDNGNHWKGFQVKAFILKFSAFKELILCDADVIIHQNPEILFNDKNYTKTGTYFFKDLDSWQFSKLNNKLEQLKQKLIFNKFHNLTFF
jgi:alpha 1,2-mannosyltransferase